VRPQQSAARIDGGEQSVGDSTGLDSCYKIPEHLVPQVSRHAGMSIMVGDNLHVMLAQRDEQQNSIPPRLDAGEMRVEFTMR
jgi:hypothetical protein